MNTFITSESNFRLQKNELSCNGKLGMIQRIQSLLLLFVAVSGVLLFFLPLFSFSMTNNENGVMTEFMVTDNIVLASITILITIIAMITIFLYSNRPLQIKLCGLKMLLLTILVVAIFYVEGKLNEGDVNVKYNSGIYLILGDLVFLWISIRLIKKDEDLVRSADRLR
jgi:hypothetical protein